MFNLSTEKFITETEEFTSHVFNNKSDVSELIEISAEFKSEEQFNELVFTAKYVKGLARILNKAPGIPEVESVEHVKKDMSENIKKFSEQLRGIVSTIEESKKKYFVEKYLSLSRESMLNLNSLLEDLEAVKKYLNYVKRS